MESQPYYIKHKDLLSSYKVFGSHMSELRVNGLRKVWAADYNDVSWLSIAFWHCYCKDHDWLLFWFDWAALKFLINDLL